MSTYPLDIKPLPQPPAFRKMIGPSFILLGLGLGSGEIILWPFLVSNFGLGIAWGILIGITIQFFINMEVERYALIYGESIFVGFARLFRWLPVWFILSTFLGFGWPGIGLSATHLLSGLLPVDIHFINISLFVLIGLILTLGKVLYNTVETLQKYLILIGTPLIIILVIYLSRAVHWQALLAGLAGQGEGFLLFPQGISLATFLGALAYSGAGGNLNLAQSFYVRDKGYGMGKYADNIRGLFSQDKHSSPIKLTGSTFEITPENLGIFKKWWKLVNAEHWLVFWVLGLLTMLALALLSYITAFGLPGNITGINFVVTEAMRIGQMTWPAVGVAFLLVTGLMLGATQLTVLDSTSRIISENILLLKNLKTASLAKIYYLVLWLQIMFGIIVSAFNINEPRKLLVTGAVVNAFSMFVYIGLILYSHNRVLDPRLRPGLVRNLILAAAFIFYGVLGALVLTS
jgi:hypothetical protein